MKAAVLLIYILVMSVATYAIFALDKRHAKHNQWRIPEFRLLLVSLYGGSPGALLAMIIFRHKTSKPSFLVKFAIVVIMQMALVFWLWK